MYIKLADLNKMGDRYIRRDIDGGILTDKFEIDKYRKQQYLDVVDNLLLGSYNEFGEYEIENEMVEELVKALQDKDVKVWYDSLSIAWGDSLRKQIDDGLKKSRFGIVVLSENYIKKGWTQYELDGLFDIEMAKGKTILPIWHNITKQQVMDFSPTLAGRKALTSATMTAEEIADTFVELIKSYDNDKTNH